jgi:hypothetical protein
MNWLDGRFGPRFGPRTDTDPVNTATGTWPARTEVPMPGLRWAVYPDGKIVLQAPFKWHQGALGGTIWKDVPTVGLNTLGEVMWEQTPPDAGGTA